MEEIAADHQPGRAEGTLESPEMVSRGPKTGLFKHSKGGQEDLAMDMDNPASGEKSGRIIENAPFFAALFDEADDQGQFPAEGLELAESRRAIGVLGDGFDQIPEFITGQAQLRKDEQVGLGPAGLGRGLQMEVPIFFKIPQVRGDLGQGDFHNVKITHSPHPDNAERKRGSVFSLGGKSACFSPTP